MEASRSIYKTSRKEKREATPVLLCRHTQSGKLNASAGNDVIDKQLNWLSYSSI
jgi:hypothetical protein